jgi:hypothetical protein
MILLQYHSALSYNINNSFLVLDKSLVVCRLLLSLVFLERLNVV